MNRIKQFVPMSVFVIASGLLILLSPIFQANMNQPDYFKQDFVNASILEVLEEDIEEDGLFPGRYTGTQEVRVELLEGDYEGMTFEISNPLSSSHYVYVEAGTQVIASVREKSDGPSVWLYNYKRDNTIYLLIGIFFAALLLLGRKQGLYSILSLVFSGIVVAFFMMPLIFNGYHPITVSIISVAIITVVSFLLISGVTRKSLIAIIGTIGGVVAAGIISFVFGQLTMLSGINMDKGSEVIFIAQDYNIQVKGLMFAGILIASLGAVMDVSMSIVSSMTEIYKISPDMKQGKLFQSGMTVGRDVMGTMSNTLILAFVGSSFNTVMLVWGYQMSMNQLMNIPFLGVEIVQGIAGSIGIIATIPLTAAAASFFLTKNKPYANISLNH